MSCLFCQMVSGDIQVEIIYQNQDLIVIYDINPLAKGHALIIPKKHQKNLFEESGEINFLTNLKEIVVAIKKKYPFEEFQIKSNIGTKAGQEIFHTHIHLIPCY